MFLREIFIIKGRLYNMKKKLTVLMLIMSLMVMSVTPTFAGQNIPLPGHKGWTYRIDKGNSSGNSNTHVHLDGPKGQEYVDGFGGKNSHKNKPGLDEAPSKQRKALKKQKKYKDAEEAAEAEQAAVKELKKSDFDWAKAADRAAAIALIAAAGATWFFPGDDAAAWANAARAWAF